MRELSIFIDESGDFGRYNHISPFYIISIVIHSQENDISEQIRFLDENLRAMSFRRDFIHVGPLIRRENEYKYMTIQERLRILRRLIKFTEKINIKQKSFHIEKKHIVDDKEMIQRLARQLSDFLKENYPYFLSFDSIKLYYDGGQENVIKIILTVFESLFKNVTYKKSEQSDYKLLQVADLVCTTRLTELKMNSNILSKTERNVLGNDKNIRRILLKPINNKEF